MEGPDRAVFGSRYKGVVLTRPGAKSFSFGIALMACVFAAACARGKTGGNSASARLPIVLVFLDTVRADRLPPYPRGQLGVKTPALDRFARESLLFSEARSPAPLTMPAMAAAMTGRYPHAVGVNGHSRSDRLSPQARTLAGIARQAGYRTAAVVTNPWLAQSTAGFARDFETFVSGRSLGRSRARMRAVEVVDRAVGILESPDPRPLFLWVHFLDAHMPYTDGEIETRITKDFAASPAARSKIFFAPPYDAAEIAATRNAYDAAIARIDAALDKLLASLPREAVVIVAADHGESLGEHGLHFAHDFTLYEELLRVPLMIRAPGVNPGINSTAVSLIDVVPTICALAGLECGQDLDGSRLPNTGGNDTSAHFARRTLYAASSPARARYRCPWLLVPGVEGRLTMALAGSRKLIRIPTPHGPKYEAYDLAVDRGETVNRFDPSADRELVAELDVWSASAAAPPAAAAPLPNSVKRELRALGYLE